MTHYKQSGLSLVLALAFAFLASFAAHAADKSPFDAAQFAKAQADNKSILVEVTAPWCPTCKAQKPILEQLTNQSKFKDLKIFEVDFDSRKDVLRDLKVNMQSTLIVYKGNTELGRSTGDTKESSIAALVDKAL